MQKIKIIIENVKAMPWVLRTATIASFVIGLVILIGTVIPIGGITIGTVYYSHNDLWSSGLAYASLVGSIFSLVFSIAACQKLAWTKYALIFMPVWQITPFFVAATFFGVNLPINNSENLISSFLWVILMSIYILFSVSVKKYFALSK